MAGRAMKGALELLKPLLAGSASTTIGKIVIGTVKGDLHDIGKTWWLPCWRVAALKS